MALEAQGYKKLVEELREAPDDWYDADLHRDAADAIETLQAEEKSRKENCEKCADATRRVITDLQGIIADLKAEVPKRGEWIHVDCDEPWEWRCTACHEIAEGHGEFRFCPNCGANMEVQDADTK
jgi:Zn finger protein HypA/HybF involved in hydrogenase expression